MGGPGVTPPEESASGTGGSGCGDPVAAEVFLGERMTDHAAGGTASKLNASLLFTITIFLSATLVFLLQPIVARLILPLLGGSAAVWTTSMAFFQGGLLVGYAYAHLLQRVGSIRGQVTIHLILLLAAALVLPLRISGMLGEADVDRPIMWLLGTLALSVGAPFAVMSATAPLVQAWYARWREPSEADRTYRLYAASNVGSLLALLSYPLIVEPLLSLSGQRILWTAGYGLFVAVLAVLGLMILRRGSGLVIQDSPAEALPAAPTWRQRAIWIALAAIPSSLMLGLTSHLTTDVASAPLFWVLPLALYLVTFILAFADRRFASDDLMLKMQLVAVALCLALLPFASDNFLLQFVVNLGAFFLSALACHSRLYDLRPHPARLTDFYLCLSLGGVIGGSLNAFLAPVLFTSVIEYPAVLVLSALALVPLAGKIDRRLIAIWIAGVAALAVAPIAVWQWGFTETAVWAMRLSLLAAIPAVFFLRHSRLLVGSILVVLALSANSVSDASQGTRWRNFFGVVSIADMDDEVYGSEIRTMTHGTTLHGAQARDPEHACEPMVYYTPQTPIGQVFAAEAARKPALNIAVTGLGAGSVAAFVRPADRMTFYEIDPLIIALSSDPDYFSYTAECAKGEVSFVAGDARLTLSKAEPDSYDVILMDAFSSDSVPTHLLTREALQVYLSKLKPDGVVIMHLSNRNLQLRFVAMASAEAAGAHALLQRHTPTAEAEERWESASDVVIFARNPEALAAYRADSRWQPSDPQGARPWTDDYSNIIGPIIGQMVEMNSG